MATTERRRALAAVGLGAIVLATVAFGSALATPPLVTSIPTVQPAPPPTEVATEPPAEEGTELLPTLEPPGAGAGADSPLMQILVTVAAVAVALVLVFLIVRAARRIAARERAAPIDEIVDEPAIDVAGVEDAVRAAREQIGVEDDPNRVVVQCWEALEAVAADAGVARDEAETATEYVIDMLTRLDLPPEPARRLARLYAAALFSRDRLPQAAVDEARDCLDRLETALHDRAGRR